MTTAADGKTRISTEEFDRKFEEGEDLIPYLDLSQARMVQPQSEGNKKATFTMPAWLIDALDERAKHLAISRNALLNVIVAEAFEAKTH